MRYVLSILLLLVGGLAPAAPMKNWVGVKAITSLDGRLYVAQQVEVLDVRLYEVDPKSLEARRIGGNTSYPNPRMTSFQGKLYLVHGVPGQTALAEVDPRTGTRKLLGTKDWTGAEAIAAAAGQLFITQRVATYDVRLFRVDPSTGEATRVGRASFPNSRMTSLNDKLYLINGIPKQMSLSEVDPKTGQWKNLGQRDWTGAVALTQLGPDLYVTRRYNEVDVRLFRVKPGTGEAERVGDYAFPNSVLTALGDRLYIVCGIPGDMILVELNPATAQRTVR
jgi:hypothetical protein